MILLPFSIPWLQFSKVSCYYLAKGACSIKFYGFVMDGKWTDSIVSWCFLPLSVTFIVLDKHSSLLHNLYITNLLCFIVRAPEDDVLKTFCYRFTNLSHFYNLQQSFRANNFPVIKNGLAYQTEFTPEVIFKFMYEIDSWGGPTS